jgi:signal-transduction protein with cAMP-binding, CBS, and nucleotidyltransferase domain
MGQSTPKSLAVGEIMTEKLESINILNTAKDAATKMTNKNVSSLVVLDDDGKALGIVTERDLARRICTTDKSSDGVTVGQIMTSQVISIKPDYLLEEAANVMIERKVRHLLVVGENNEPVGIITPTDLAAYMKETADIRNDKMNSVILQVLREHRRYI